MKSLRIFTLAAIALLVAPSLLAADFGVRAGRYNNGDGEFVGAELMFDLGALNINPNVEYIVNNDDDVNAGTANLDVTVEVLDTGVVVPYLGAGIGLAYANGFGTNTDVVGNLIGGIGLRLATLTPYAQVKYFRLLDNDEGADDGDDLALTIGLRF